MPEAIIAISAKPKPGDTDGPEFTIPPDLDLSQLKDGETKEVLAVIKKTDDKNACIVSIEGVKLGSDGDGNDIEDETDEQDDQSPPPTDQPFPQQGMAQARSAGLM